MRMGTGFLGEGFRGTITQQYSLIGGAVSPARQPAVPCGDKSRFSGATQSTRQTPVSPVCTLSVCTLIRTIGPESGVVRRAVSPQQAMSGSDWGSIGAGIVWQLRENFRKTMG